MPDQRFFLIFLFLQVFHLQPKHYALFKLNLTGFTEEGYFYGENFVDTEFERIKIPFSGRAIQGSLDGEKIIISNCFPGRISSQTIRLSSSFSSELSLKSVNILPEEETRFVFDPVITASDSKNSIKFGENIIGKIYFDPYKSCGPTKTCYSGLETSKEGKFIMGSPAEVQTRMEELELKQSTSSLKPKLKPGTIYSYDLVGHLWLLGLALHPDTGYIDKELHKLLHTRWTSIPEHERTYDFFSHTLKFIYVNFLTSPFFLFVGLVRRQILKLTADTVFSWVLAPLFIGLESFTVERII